jgi:Peptidase inhibitor I78 family
MSIWVYRADGTVQCSSSSGESLEAAKADLVMRIGDKNVIGPGEKRTLPGMRSALCGLPTGRVNAFEITAEGSDILFHGIIGAGGWLLWRPDWETAAGGPEVPFPWTLTPAAGAVATIPPHVAMANSLSIADKPSTIKELIGHPLRVIRPGDAVTFDYMPGRVNIVVDDHNIIQDIGFY